MYSKQALEAYRRLCRHLDYDNDDYMFNGGYEEDNEVIENALKDYETIKKDLDRLEKSEKVIELCLTKYVPLDSLSPSFWESKEVWLSNMNYEYYLFLCEEYEYVIKENRKLTLDEFDLIYELLKEWLENGK